jgi:aminopeptidase N
MGLKLLFVFLFLSVSAFSQQLEYVDFKQVDAELEIFINDKMISSKATYHFKILQNTDSIFLDARDITRLSDNLTENSISLQAKEDKIWLYAPFKEGVNYSVSFFYEAHPQQAMYFFDNEVWTQGQGRNNSHWLPSIDDENDKMIFNISITAPNNLTVLANGKLNDTRPVNEGQNHWVYTMQHPMSSYLAAIVAGKFSKYSETSSSGISLEYYLAKGDEDKMEPTFRYTKQMFDFLEQEIGLPYPWQVNKQVAVSDFLHAGMENTTLTVFSKAFVVDSIGFNDRNYVNVNAHELAHHWFGNLVTAESSEHHWLQEGFATYYALLAEREIFGEDYYYWKLYQSAEQLTELSNEGKGEPLVKKGASSLTYYQKGAWALHILRERIGDLVFRQAVQNFLTKHQFSSVNTDDFLKEVQLLTNDDLQWFKDDWLYQNAFRSYQALESLRKSPFMENYLGLTVIAAHPLAQKETVLSRFLNLPVNDYLGQEVVYQLVDVPKKESISLYKKAFQSNNLFVRQAIAMSLEQIPTELKKDYETLLDDLSYATREAALYHLWINFPEDRFRYLDKMDNQMGFQDKNIRQLWLTLAIVTENYRNSQKPDFFNQLSSYTNPMYSFEIRQNAFQYLYGLNGFTRQNLKHLIDACVHHNWRFRNSNRELFDLLLKDSETKELVRNLLEDLPEQKKEWVKTRLE